MQNYEGKSETTPGNSGLFEFLASWEPLREEDAMPEIERPPAEPFTEFDDWVEEVK
jgi:hypothetical protein